MPFTPDTIAAKQELVQYLAEISEVELRTGEPERAMYTVEGINDLEVFGRDGSGGQFAVSQASGLVFYFTSEGEAGVLAKDFLTFLTIAVALPDWRSVLKYSARGQLAEMRRAARVVEEELFDEEAVMLRDQVLELLGLGKDIDVVAALHAAVSSNVVIHDQWGNLTASLFNSFTIDDNPMWRPAAG